jgi:NAD(P)-dependent dehydrogenase (short-subunit alcohol dehydrogenase family)
MKFNGKAVFITGGAKRIGAEIARFFVREGARVGVSYHTSEGEAFALKEELGRACHLFKADLQDVKAGLEAFKRAFSVLGKVHILVNNASIFEKNSILSITEEEFDRDFAIQLKTPLFLTQAFAKQEFEAEEGLIINMLDKNIVRKNTAFVSYLLSKKALDELTRFSAFSLAPKIRVNSISPGFILEESWTESLTAEEFEAHLERKLKNIPLKRKGSVQDILNAVEFFATNSYINGVNINVDGGSFLF